jgi:hypothetical protein
MALVLQRLFSLDDSAEQDIPHHESKAS